MYQEKGSLVTQPSPDRWWRLVYFSADSYYSINAYRSAFVVNGVLALLCMQGVLAILSINSFLSVFSLDAFGSIFSVFCCFCINCSNAFLCVNLLNRVRHFQEPFIMCNYKWKLLSVTF